MRTAKSEKSKPLAAIVNFFCRFSSKKDNKKPMSEADISKLRAAFDHLNSMGTFVSGLVILYQCRELPVTEVDTREFPDCPFALLMWASTVAPEVVKVLVSDRRLGQTFRSFDRLLEYLRTIPEAIDHLEVIFKHQSVRALVNHFPMLEQLHEVIPHSINRVFDKYPDLIQKNIQTFEQLKDSIERMPGARRKLILWRLGLVKTAAEVVNVIKMAPELADDILFKRNFISLFVTEGQLVPLIRAWPDVAPKLLANKRHRSRFIQMLCESKGGCLMAMVYADPTVLEELLSLPALHSMFTKKGFVTRIVGALIRACSRNKKAAAKVLADHYARDYSPLVEKNPIQAELYTRKMHEIRKLEIKQRVGKRQRVSELLSAFKGKSFEYKLAYIEDRAQNIQVLETDDGTHLLRLLIAHPDVVNAMVTKLGVAKAMSPRLLARAITEAFNLCLEKRELMGLISFARLYIDGHSPFVQCDFDRARHCLDIVIQLIKRDGVPEAVCKQVFRLKHDWGEKVAAHYRSNPRAAPVQQPKSLTALFRWQPGEEAIFNSITHELTLHARVDNKALCVARESALINRLKGLSTETLFRFSERSSGIKRLCKDPRMASFWQDVLYDGYNRLPDRYSLLGTTFEHVMGEFLLSHYNQFRYLGREDEPSALNFIRYATNMHRPEPVLKPYRSPLAFIVMHGHYLKKLNKNGGATQKDIEALCKLANQLVKDYWSLGFVLAADIYWAMASHAAETDLERTRFMVTALEYLHCAEHFAMTKDTQTVLSNVPTTLVEYTHGMYDSFESARTAFARAGRLTSSDLDVATAAAEKRINELEARREKDLNEAQERQHSLPEPEGRDELTQDMMTRSEFLNCLKRAGYDVGVGGLESDVVIRRMSSRMTL